MDVLLRNNLNIDILIRKTSKIQVILGKSSKSGSFIRKIIWKIDIFFGGENHLQLKIEVLLDLLKKIILECSYYWENHPKMEVLSGKSFKHGGVIRKIISKWMLY